MGRGGAQQDANIQQGFNRQALHDVIGANQVNQQTPWGSISYSGEIGSPNRTQHVQLNPYESQALDMQRMGRQQILGALIGGVPGQEGVPGGGKPAGAGAPMPPPGGGPMGPMPPMNQGPGGPQGPKPSPGGGAPMPPPIEPTMYGGG